MYFSGDLLKKGAGEVANTRERRIFALRIQKTQCPTRLKTRKVW